MSRACWAAKLVKVQELHDDNRELTKTTRLQGKVYFYVFFKHEE